MPRRASGSQSQSTQTNGRRRREEEEEVDEEEEEHGEEEEEGEDEPTQTQGGRVENQRKKAAALAKMALLGEYSRRPLKRADVVAASGSPSIGKNVLSAVLNGNSRAFPHVLTEAQDILRSKFGMELVELRPRTKVDAAGNAVGGPSSAGQIPAATQATQTLSRKRKERALDAIDEEEEDEDEEEDEGHANGNGEEEPITKKQKKQPNTGIFILRNALPLELRKALSTPNPLPAFNGAGHRLLVPEENVDQGVLIQWEKGDGSHGHPALMGIRALILSLILARGRVISDDDLHAYLKRLGLYRDTELPYQSPNSRESTFTLDKYLELLAKQNYLEKTKIAQTAPGAEGHKIEWRWGSREAEWSEKAAHQWIQAINIDSQEETFEDEDDPATQHRRDPQERNTAEKTRKQLAKDIASAAGSELTGEL